MSQCLAERYSSVQLLVWYPDDRGLCRCLGEVPPEMSSLCVYVWSTVPRAVRRMNHRLAQGTLGLYCATLELCLGFIVRRWDSVW